MSLALVDIQNLLEAEFLSTPIQINRLQDEPDEVICVTAAGGGTPIIDGAFEEAHIIVRCRAGANDDATAEALALAVHEFFSSIEGSQQMGSTYVMSILPTSGPPIYSGWDVSLRTIYQGSYMLRVAV